ncbi:MAG: hypothetical protein JJU28_03740 [Cyclobacteriaceae bacterium]|nr:hypothetical protein [Cyclobacteriaceae bacterium]
MKVKVPILPFILLAFVGLSLVSCEKETFISPIPPTFVQEQINLNDLRYRSLRNIRGFIYYPEAGFKGLIVFRESNTVYRVFDRACPFDPLVDKAIVEVDSSTLFMLDRHCGSQFDFNGQPIGGPAQAPMREYRSFLEGNFLIVLSN